MVSYVIVMLRAIAVVMVKQMICTLQHGAIGFKIAETSLNPVGLTMWYHYDRLGNVMDLTDEYGGITDSYDQDDFGNVLSGSPSGYHLTTKEFSPPIGLYYFYKRWYEPKLGRFIKFDILRREFTKDGINFNLYLYSNNNPIRYIDFMGLACSEAFACSLIGGLICAIVCNYCPNPIEPIIDPILPPFLPPDIIPNPIPCEKICGEAAEALCEEKCGLPPAPSPGVPPGEPGTDCAQACERRWQSGSPGYWRCIQNCELQMPW
ncbi:MAG: hypothetical protein N2246_10820 [Candidatus Sumerlaeia bacterium]|nr:hypothetical protein [Candidatus Sumerlaeia bacterium]